MENCRYVDFTCYTVIYIDIVLIYLPIVIYNTLENFNCN